jgi:hypothetical protein
VLRRSSLTPNLLLLRCCCCHSCSGSGHLSRRDIGSKLDNGRDHGGASRSTRCLSWMGKIFSAVSSSFFQDCGFVVKHSLSSRVVQGTTLHSRNRSWHMAPTVLALSVCGLERLSAQERFQDCFSLMRLPSAVLGPFVALATAPFF